MPSFPVGEDELVAHRLRFPGVPLAPAVDAVGTAKLDSNRAAPGSARTQEGPAPLAVHLLQSPQQELPETAALLDLAEDRLHSLHLQGVALPAPPGQRGRRWQSANRRPADPTMALARRRSAGCPGGGSCRRASPGCTHGGWAVQQRSGEPCRAEDLSTLGCVEGPDTGGCPRGTSRTSG